MYIAEKESENKEIIKRYRSLLRTMGPSVEAKDKVLVRKAFNLALEAHKDMRRKTGEPYIYHPLAVAKITSQEIGLGITSIVCALLHDVVEDTDYTLKDIKTQFGDKIAKIIDGLTKIEEIFDHTTSSIQAENFKKMLLTLSDDVRVILIKLADRLHNMRTLDAMSKEKQLKIASETIYLYAPLALRLGLYAIKSELEDLGLKYTEPDIYDNLMHKIQQTDKMRKDFVRKFSTPLKKDLRENHIGCTIETETKSVFSIWEKMKSRELPFDEVFDSFAVRFIINTDKKHEKVDCWRVYTIVTDHYKPNVEKLRDWVSIPKSNGYEAIHATVMSKKGRWVDIQIRSRRMHEIARKGYVALWKQNSNGGNGSSLDGWLDKIREVLNSEDTGALDFLSDVKLTLFSDEIFVFTPKGDMKSLPNGATVLDFAYNIHSQIGDESIGAKVNHNLVPLNHILKSGDQVEIITSRKQYPKEEWFKYAVTARAKSRIKDSLRNYRKKFKAKGKEKLNKLFGQANVEFTGANVQKLQQSVNIPSSIDLYYQVSNDMIGSKEIRNVFPEEDKSWFKLIRNPFSKNPKNLSESLTEKVRSKPESLILGGDTASVDYDIAECCNSIPGDDVVGFIRENKPIEIHTTNCPVAIGLMSKYGNRIVKAKWKKEEKITFLAGVKISGLDRAGLIYKITNIISEKHHLNIRLFNIESSKGVMNGVIMFYAPDADALNELINSLKKVKEIRKVSRIKRLPENYT
ncbi:MAG: RelA/SpoT family protein [Bacteroidales bacterium]|nr:RelA/SpoT family protein [Bacteroidales bacterium]MCF8350804.1 RelA/SpoT family protein [Bacteroidales bacterium]MCF8374789.1 RelA/SpoT family protein [Bacteroidales bacterium]MCF8399807.1 RelA/SpoT family protein [Bacteroidales bacterium]